MINMGNSDNHLEIEVKFFLPDMGGIRDKVAQAGICSHPSIFETNIRYDDGEGHLTRSRRLLRLRKDTRSRLTFKSPPLDPTHDDTEFKVFRELEVEVNDFDTMHAILDALGFQRVQVYEKRRETFQWNDCALCFDTTPFGDFLEIEGERERIRQAAQMLGLEWTRRITTNYLSMFETLRDKFGWSFSNLTFDNFQTVEFDFSEHASMFEAGASE